MKGLIVFLALLFSPAIVQGQIVLKQQELPVDYHVNPAAFEALELKVADHDQQIAVLKGEMGEMKVLVINLGDQLLKLQQEMAKLHPVRTEVPAPVEALTPDQLPVVDVEDQPLTDDNCVDGQCGVSYSSSNSGRVVFRRGGLGFRRR